MIKKYADHVDGTLKDCERLSQCIGEAYKSNTDHAMFVDSLISAMIKTGQSKFYSIADPGKMVKNFGTIITKVKSEMVQKNKPTTVSFKEGKMVKS